MQVGCGGHVLNISCQCIMFAALNYISTKSNGTRGIYYGLGCAKDPDVDNYYEQACAFPMVYSPDEDPEVVEEMKIAEVELKGGSGTKDGEDIEDVDQKSSDEDSTGEEGDEEGDEDGEGDWVDADEIKDDTANNVDQPTKKKRKQKVLSYVEKVCIYRNLKSIDIDKSSALCNRR